MRKLIVSLLLFIVIFSLGCDNGKQVVINREEIYSKIIIENGIDEYRRIFLDAIIDEDLETIITYFEEEVIFGDDELGNNVSAFKDNGYNGFLNKEGELYALFFDSEMLNELNNDINNSYGFDFLQYETICIRDSLPICDFLSMRSENQITLNLGDKTNHQAISIVFQEDARKIRFITYRP